MDDDEDWDADFGLLPTDEEPSNDSKQPPRVFGITASSKENWDDDDDFAFDDGESSDIFAAKRGLESLPNALKKVYYSYFIANFDLFY
jgi:hypothetical protein